MANKKFADRCNQCNKLCKNVKILEGLVENCTCFEPLVEPEVQLYKRVPSLEERAERYARVRCCNTCEANGYGCCYRKRNECPIYSGYHDMYSKIAIEQRNTDIELACKIVVEIVEDLQSRHCEAWGEEAKQKTLDNIRKTMEGEENA